MPKTEKQRIGKIGEDIACKYLEKQGFSIVERNYWKKYGEIDIVAKKEGILHFIEVKSVSRQLAPAPVTRVTGNKGGIGEYRPEDNLHSWKLRRLGRTIQVYLEERGVSPSYAKASAGKRETVWQVDAITVLVDERKRVGRVEVLENIVI